MNEHASIKVMMRTAGIFLGLAGLIFFGGQPLQAFACGDVIVEFYGDDDRTPIEDCSNPFRADVPAPFSHTLVIADQPITPGATISVAEDEYAEGSFFIDREGNFNPDPLTLFRKEGTDYRRVKRISQSPFSIKLTPGEYVAVLVYEEMSVPIVQELPLWQQWLKSFFLPTTAYAYYPDYKDVVAIPFTVTYETPPPTGPSSVLFLPGIMGSHLYEESDECFGRGEQRRWFSTTDCEQLRLLTNPDGSSINDIYTKFEDDAIADTISIAGVTVENLYTDFMTAMNALEADQTIKDFIPLPYDWRLRLDHIIRAKKDSDSTKVRYQEGTSLQEGIMYQTLAAMAERSYNGKVTIVTHSNGGLVAKAFLAELTKANDPLLAKIDNLILIGSPQVGTPDAVHGILHGVEIGPGGFVTTQETARTLLNTAAFGHHLLPSEEYFNGAGVTVETPVINFEEGLATNSWIIQYGETINNFAELKRFLDDESGRVNPPANDLITPEVVEGTLLTYAEEIANELADWVPPSNLKVYQLGGSGIWTPSRVEYSSNDYCARADAINISCAAYQQRLFTELHWTLDGDGTVVLPSALAMSESENVERLWVDLNDFNNDFRRENVHKDILGVPEVIKFVQNVTKSASDTYQYIVSNPPPVPQDIRLLFHLHSPLDMYITSDQGMVSSTTNEIRGAFYRRFGEVQYISLPEGITNATLHLVGYDDGSFTLVKELWEGEYEKSSIDFKALPTSSSTIVTLPVSYDESGTMIVDFNGDGIIDGTVKESEDVISPVDVDSGEPEVILDQNDKSSGTSGTKIQNRSVGIVAGVSTDNRIEQMKEIIRLLNEIISLLKRKTIYENI